MSYVDNNLLPGEAIQYRATRHWIVLLVPAFFAALFLLGALGSFAGSVFSRNRSGNFFSGVFLLGIAVLLSAIAFFRWKAIEMAVTSRRLVAKQGILRTRSLEMAHTKVESVQINQGLLGKALDYGTVTIRGIGGTPEPFADIRSPFEFRRQVQSISDPTA